MCHVATAQRAMSDLDTRLENFLKGILDYSTVSNFFEGEVDLFSLSKLF